MTKSKFTEQQLKNWKRYEDVRKSGRHNMLTPNARQATGLEREDYWFCVHNYSELKEEIDKTT